MALSTDAQNTEARPTLADLIRGFLPEHAHFLTSHANPGERPRRGSFKATWTTPAGVWTVTYTGPRTGELIAAAFIGQPAAEPQIIVAGPPGTWTFPADPDRAPGQVRRFLEVAAAITERVPPAPRGFVYIGRADEDGLSFTTEGPVNPDAANLIAGRPVYATNGRHAA
jgi:hypothetical protein